MAQLGKLEFTILDGSGAPVSGATIEVRKQGAQVRGGAGASPYTVDDVGAVATGASVKLYALATKIETSAATATVNSATSIGTAPNLGSAADDDRLTISSPLPTIYEDANAGTSTGNPFTTDTTGYANCYAEAGYYDVKVSGTGIVTRLYTDVVCNGAKATAYVFDQASAAGFRSNIVSSATGAAVGTAGAVIHEFCNAGTRKAAIDKDGDYTGTDGHFANLDTSATLSVGTNETVGGTLGVTGASTLAALTASGLITGSAGLTISAGAVSLPASSLAVAALASGITAVTFKTQSGDLLLTTTPTTITGLDTGSITISSTSSNILLLGQSQFTNASASVREVALGIYEDGVLLAATSTRIPVTPNGMNTFSAMHIRTGVSGPHTYTLKASQSVGNDVTSGNGTGRFIVIELKK